MKALIFILGSLIASTASAADVYCYVNLDRQAGMPPITTEPFAVTDAEWHEIDDHWYKNTTSIWDSWHAFVRSKGYTAEDHCRPIIHNRDSTPEGYERLDPGTKIIAWTPSNSRAGKTAKTPDSKLDKDKRYALFHRSSKDGTGFGSVDIDIYKEKAVGCEDQVVDTIHLELGQKKFYECNPEKVGTAAGICYGLRYQNYGKTERPASMGCTPPTPKEVTM